MKINLFKSSILLTFCFVFVTGSLEAKAEPPNIVVNLHGTAKGVDKFIDGVPMVCFDVDLRNLNTGKVIGQGTDCLNLLSNLPIGDDGGFGIDNTTFFNFHRGTVVALSRTTIQPAESGNGVFITGAVSVDEDNIQTELGTHRFRNATGKTRLSGIVDMSEFNENTIISFDCIFVIDLN